MITNQTYLTPQRAELNFDLPLSEILFDFYDRLKTFSKGYASFDYSPSGMKNSKLVKGWRRLFFKQKVNQHYTDKKSIPYKDYWENIGYHFGSIIALSYYSYISQHFNSNKDELIFVGRDGYSLKLFFDILNPQWKSHYINLPRILVEKCNYPINLNEEENIDFLYDLYNLKERKARPTPPTRKTSRPRRGRTCGMSCCSRPSG